MEIQRRALSAPLAEAVRQLNGAGEALLGEGGVGGGVGVGSGGGLGGDHRPEALRGAAEQLLRSCSESAEPLGAAGGVLGALALHGFLAESGAEDDLRELCGAAVQQLIARSPSAREQVLADGRLLLLACDAALRAMRGAVGAEGGGGGGGGGGGTPPTPPPPRPRGAGAPPGRRGGRGGPGRAAARAWRPRAPWRR